MRPRSISAFFLHLRDLCTQRNGRETGWCDAKPTLSKLNTECSSGEAHYNQIVSLFLKVVQKKYILPQNVPVFLIILFFFSGSQSIISSESMNNKKLEIS